MVKQSFLAKNKNVVTLLVIELVAVCVFFLYSQATNSHVTPVPGLPSKPVVSSPEEYLARINKERAKIDAPALTIDPTLNTTAKAKANDMVSKNYFSHDTADGVKFNDFIEQYRPLNAVVGENLSKCYVGISGVMEGWINSLEHYKNIMDTRWKYFGSDSEINPKDGCMVVVNHFSD